jgi:transposase
VQELSKTHEAIAKAKTEIQHRILTHYLSLYFPEIERFRGNSRSDWYFAFLDAFPTPASIIALSKEAFIEAAWDVVGRKVSKERLLADIYETARTSIGLPLPIDAPAIRMFRMVIAEARSLIRQRNEIEDMADAMLRDSADYKALRKVPGIGPVIALTILAEGVDLRRFRHHRQFLKFCGLDLSTQRQSLPSSTRRICLIGADAGHSGQARCRSARAVDGHWRRAPSLLASLIFNSDGARLSPTHAVKKGKRYRY